MRSSFVPSCAEKTKVIKNTCGIFKSKPGLHIAFMGAV